MATPQNPNGVYVNTITLKEPENLCCYKAIYPACMSKNIFLTTTVLETEGTNPTAGSMANIVASLKEIARSTKLLALDAAIAPNIVPLLTAVQKSKISADFKAIIG
jgi:hypothetical protein